MHCEDCLKCKSKTLKACATVTATPPFVQCKTTLILVLINVAQRSQVIKSLYSSVVRTLNWRLNHQWIIL